MIKISISKENSLLNELKVHGHAGYAEYGKDIVCAAVSVLTYTLIESLEVVLALEKEKYKYRVDEETGIWLEINQGLLNQEEKHDIRLLTEMYYTGILKSTEDYRDFVKITIREV